MNSNLARILIERGVIQRGTILDSYYTAKGISCQCDTSVLGRFKLIGAQATSDWVYFVTMLPDTTEQYRIRCDYVTAVDGMPLQRLAEAQQLNDQGDAVIPKSRRGQRLAENLTKIDSDVT